jgi:hypothetical protein
MYDTNMKTTLDIKDNLLASAKAAAALQRTTLTRLIEEGLEMRLRKITPPISKAKIKIPVFHGKGGLVRGLTGLSNRKMLDAADEQGK